MLENLKKVMDCNLDPNALKTTLAEVESIESKNDSKWKLLTKETIRFVNEIAEEYHSCVTIIRNIEDLKEAQKQANVKLEELQKKYEQQERASEMKFKIASGVKRKRKREEKQKKESLHQDMFAKYLGLSLSPVGPQSEKEGYMKFSFSNLVKKKPDETFSFGLSTDGETYCVFDCTPKIPEMDDLLKELNKTNDLQTFVIEVRKHFCNIAASSS